MTHANLVRTVAALTGQSRAVTANVLDTFATQLAVTVWADGRHVVPGLGAFVVKNRKERQVLDPEKPEGIYTKRRVWLLPAHRVVTCRVASNWRAR